MALDNTITISGNTTREPELRYTPSGHPVANFSVAVNRRWQDKATGETNEAVTFIDITAWGDLAENAAETLPRGARVLITGRLDQDTWETETGDKRHRHSITADDIAPSLKWATADITRNDKNRPPTNTVKHRPTHNPDEEPF